MQFDVAMRVARDGGRVQRPNWIKCWVEHSTTYGGYQLVGKSGEADPYIPNVEEMHARDWRELPEDER